MIKYVCVVDDNGIKTQDVVESVRTMYPGVRVYCFTCADQFLDFLSDRRTRPMMVEQPEDWLFLIDVQMPLNTGQPIESRCGYHVLSTLSERRLCVPAILVSADDVDDAFARESYGHYKGSVKYRVWNPFSVRSDIDKLLQTSLQDTSGAEVSE